MDKFKKFKNKYVITIIVFMVYILFLDNADIFAILRKEIKLNQLKQKEKRISIKFQKTKSTLKKLDNTAFLESYARENKLFKREKEDIFVIVKEE